MRNKKILVFGTIPNKNPKSIGGVNIVIQNIVNYLTEQRVAFDFFNARRIWIKYGLLIDSIFSVPKLLFRIPKYDVLSIHATRDITLLIAPLIVSYAYLINKKVIYHVLAGNFHNTFEKIPAFYQKLIIKNVFNKSSIVFFETLTLIDFFKDIISSEVRWLPNARKGTTTPFQLTPYTKKFVFISRVTIPKGILVAKEAFSQLSDEYKLDVYGPIGEDCKDIFEKTLKNVEYKGILSSTEVSGVLNQYSYLILPTFHPGEGYPGIIIEALKEGTPVITTYWNSIPEIITNDFNGKLIRPNNVSDLHHTILNLTATEYPDLSQNAFDSFKKFDRDIVYKKLIDAYAEG